MATLVPALSQCLGRMQSGEKRFARRLEEKLEDDYLIWYDVPIGGKALHPDFIVLHPRRGLLILEVKDWRRDSMVAIDKARVHLLADGAVKEARNPFEQAREYAHEIATVLKRDPSLIHHAGQYRGQLRFPWSYGVVLSNVTRAQFDQSDLCEVIPPSRVICKDEFGEDVPAEEFQQRLWNMMPWTPKEPLSLPAIDRVRWHIFPELRLGGSQLDLFAATDPETTIPDVIRIMDLQQEQLARSLGAGHRVIHGVAGSGKTMILGYRCLHLARILHKPILVLCFNRSLAGWLDGVIASKGLSAQASVRTFHAWCRDQLVHFHVGLPPDNLDPGSYAEQLVQRVIRGVDRGLIPRAQYGAVLIDEGHDFQPEWLKLVSQLVDPNTNSLLLLYDDAQSIYRRPPFSFKSVGIQAQGRTTILRLNYRSTAEILRFAYELTKHALQPHDADDDSAPLIAPESAGRHGPEPELIELPTLSEELDYIAGRFLKFHQEGTSWHEMAVLYRTRSIGDVAVQRLRRAGIPVQWVGKAAGQTPLSSGEDSVKLLTYHSSKGLEFPVVGIPGAGRPVSANVDLKEESRLLYVAMTRAMERLLVTCGNRSAFTNTRTEWSPAKTS